MKSDEDLARACAAGDDLAFAALYNRYKRPVYTFALKMLMDPDRASDAFQAVFMKIFEERSRLAGIERFKAWIFTAARNVCLNELRHDGYRDSSAGVMDGLEAPDLLVSIEQQDEAAVVAGALRALKAEYREVLILREYQDLSYAEIAEITRSSESAVKSRLFKARRQMYDILRPVFMKG